MLIYSNHSSMLFHGNCRLVAFAFKAEQRKDGQQHTVKDNKLGFILARGLWINPAKKLNHKITLNYLQ